MEKKKNSKKTNKTCAILYYCAAVCGYLSAALNFWGRNSVSTGVMWFCIGSMWVCLGSVYVSRMRREKDGNTDADSGN